MKMRKLMHVFSSCVGVLQTSIHHRNFSRLHVHLPAQWSGSSSGLCLAIALSLHVLTLQVPALNLSNVARDSPTKSPSRRALQPAEYDTNSSALVFKQPKKVTVP